MEVILLTKMENLGNLGDIVQVRSGYARNYLIPQNKAKVVNEQNLEVFKQCQAELEAKQQKEIDEAMAIYDTLHEKTVRIKANVRSDGGLYGSVGANEIIEAIKETHQHEVSKNQVRLPHGVFRETGIFFVDIFLYTDVYAKVQLEIVAQE